MFDTKYVFHFNILRQPFVHVEWTIKYTVIVSPRHQLSWNPAIQSLPSPTLASIYVSYKPPSYAWLPFEALSNQSTTTYINLPLLVVLCVCVCVVRSKRWHGSFILVVSMVILCFFGDGEKVMVVGERRWCCLAKGDEKREVLDNLFALDAGTRENI